VPYCPKCGVDNPAAARFCDQCGAALIPVPAPAVSAPAYIPPATPAAAPPPRPAAAPASLGGAVQCAQCGASALPGEAFCDNCGAPLQAGTPAPSVGTGAAPQAAYPAPVAAAPAYAPPPAAAPAVRAALAPARLVLKSGAALPLPAAGQAVLGRSDPVSNFTPDIDFAAHGAIDSGVGRRHARLFIQQGQVMLEDLDSTNGTFLNGNRLKPRQAMPIRDQDTLQLGSLALQFFF